MTAVTMYSTQWCGYCHRLKSQLDREGIAYQVIDIEDDPAAADIVMRTRPDRPEAGEKTKRFVRYGAGPRAAQAMVLGAKARALVAGRYNASMEDLASVALPAVRHRIALNFDGMSEGVRAEEILAEAVEAALAGAARA